MRQEASIWHEQTFQSVEELSSSRSYDSVVAYIRRTVAMIWFRQFDEISNLCYTIELSSIDATIILNNDKDNIENASHYQN